MLSTLLLVNLLALLVLPSLAAVTSHLVNGLPTQPTVSFKQYAGYITVNETAGRNLFYWFYEADHSNHSALPLTIWFNGGPGCSSVGGGALVELGPFHTNDSGTGLLINNFSWNKAANILFLESPAGVGFSYTNSSEVYNDENTANDALTFIVEWLRKFPEYSQNDLYLAGESYAGHYIPTLALKILKYNNATNNSSLNFKGFAIGNAFTDAFIDLHGRVEFFHSHSLISDDIYEDVVNFCYANQSCTECRKKCDSASSVLSKDISKLDVYNVYGPRCNKAGVAMLLKTQFSSSQLLSTPSATANDTCFDSISPYLNMKSVKAALHASENITWSICNWVVHGAYSYDDFKASMVPLYRELLESGLRMWIYSGDFDSVVPTLGTLKWLRSLNLTVEVPWYPWKLRDQVGGWAQVYKGLTFTTVRGAGHMVPADQPESALKMFMHFLGGIQLPGF